MWRENRRVQAMSWGSTGSDDPPPKPSRVPATLIGTSGGGGCGGGHSRTASMSGDMASGPTTYLVAPNSEVLAQLMRENESRSDAGLYTAPASAFNTFTVEFVNPSCPSSSVAPASPQHKAKAKTRKQQQQPEYANVVNTPPPVTGSTTTPAAVNRDVRTA